MVTSAELMAKGMPAGMAGYLGEDVAATGLVATGTTQAGALALASSFSIFGTVGSGAGAILPARGTVLIVNGGTNPLLLYPPLGGNINGGTTNASFSVTNGKSAYATSNGLTWFVNLSA